MFFTLIIPAYNCEETIDRLMESIVNQHFDDLKVIVVDDSDKNHPNLDKNYLDKYRKNLTIDYYVRDSVPYACHCPGNTRHAGLNIALKEDTEYILFVDNDDELVPDSLSKIYEGIQKYHPLVVLTPFFSYAEGVEEPLGLEKTNIGWLHGKFYNKDFLARNNIQFKIDLLTHEDVYFNTCVNCALIKENSDFFVIEELVYKWYHRINSESHKKAYETGQNFLEEHFEDYIMAATLPICQAVRQDPAHNQIYGANIINNIITSYFYMQGFIYNSHNVYSLYNEKNYKLCKWQINEAINAFHFNIYAIISLAYDQPEVFMNNRVESAKGTGPFVETESFKDYILRMDFYKTPPNLTF